MTHLDTSELELRAGWGMGGGESGDGRRREQEMDISQNVLMDQIKLMESDLQEVQN